MFSTVYLGQVRCFVLVLKWKLKLYLSDLSCSSFHLWGAHSPGTCFLQLVRTLPLLYFCIFISYCLSKKHKQKKTQPTKQKKSTKTPPKSTDTCQNKETNLKQTNQTHTQQQPKKTSPIKLPTQHASLSCLMLLAFCAMVWNYVFGITAFFWSAETRKEWETNCWLMRAVPCCMFTSSWVMVAWYV